jgi:hypothetical protein
MKQSQVYRNLAEKIKYWGIYNYEDGPSFICPAFAHTAKGDRQRTLFIETIHPSNPESLHGWYGPVGSDFNQDCRITALLLMAEIIEGGGL